MPATVAPNRFKAHQGRISQIRIRGFVGSFPRLEQPPGETTHHPQRSISSFARTDPFKEQSEKTSQVLPELAGTAPRGGQGVWVFSLT